MNSDEKKIRAVFILEVIGRPPEHLINTLEDLQKKMGEEQGIRVVEKKIREPTPMKEQKEFFASFMEVELEADEILNLALLMFKYMPAHVEILSPQNLALSNAGFNDLLNELVRRLHGYEEITRMLQAEKMILENQLKTIVGVDKKEVKEKIKKPKRAKKKNE